MIKAVTLAALLLGACTHDNGATSTMPARALESSSIDVTLASGETVEAHATYAPGGAAILVDGAGRPIPLDAVRTVDDTSHALGAVQGLGIGFLVGALVGGTIGYAD